MDRQITKWYILVAWFEWLQCRTVNPCGGGSSPLVTAKRKNKFNYYKTYENIETKTLNVYVSIEQLVFEFFQ